MVKAAANEDRWIMEGVYGQLVKIVLTRATALIWIDLPEEAATPMSRKEAAWGGRDPDAVHRPSQLGGGIPDKNK